MRLPEKTIELNFCAELTALWAQRGMHVLWFGPTQRQEAKFGFDAATRFGGRLYLFQFKASRTVRRNGTRRFTLPHEQLQLLQQMCNRVARCVFYVFPTIGTTSELQSRPSVFSTSLLMDVQPLPAPFPQPTGRGGQLRKNGCHYADVDESRQVVSIHSDPVNARLLPASVLAESDDTEPSSGVPDWTFDEFTRQIEELGAKFGRQLQCAVVWRRYNW